MALYPNGLNRLRDFLRSRPFIGAGTGYTFVNAEASAFVARMTTPPSDTYKAAVDQFWTDLKAAGLATGAFDVMSVPAGADAASGLLWMIGSQYTKTVSGSPVFDPYYGYTTNGVGAYVDWGWAPSNGVLFTQNNASFGAWLRRPEAQATTGEPSVGCNTAASASTYLNPWDTSGNGEKFKINCSSTQTTGQTATSGEGLSIAVRDSSTTSRLYRGTFAANAVAQSGPDSATVSSAPSSATIRLGNSLATFAENQALFSFAGRALTSSEVSALYAAMRKFLVSLGYINLTLYTPQFTGIPSYTQAAANALITLPDGVPNATAGKGWTCVGMARDPDGSWWVGDYGREGQQSTTTTGANIVHMASDFSGSPISIISLASLGFTGAAMQGVCIGLSMDGTDPNSLWINILTTIVNCSRTGTLYGSFAVTAGNGVAYDSKRDLLIIGYAAANLQWYTRAGVKNPANAPAAVANIYGPDQLQYLPDLDAVTATTGANGAVGQLARIDLHANGYGAPRLNRLDSFTGATSIEQIYRTQAGGPAYGTNDGYYHGSGGLGLNQIQVFNAFPY